MSTPTLSTMEGVKATLHEVLKAKAEAYNRKDWEREAYPEKYLGFDVGDFYSFLECLEKNGWHEYDRYANQDRYFVIYGDYPLGDFTIKFYERAEFDNGSFADDYSKWEYTIKAGSNFGEAN